jgi:hypothetical protein
MPGQPPADQGEGKQGERGEGKQGEEGGTPGGGEDQGGQGQGGQGQGGQGGQGQGGQFGTSKQDAGSAELELPSSLTGAGAADQNPCVDPQGLRNC